MVIRLIMCFFAAIALSIRFPVPEGLEEAAGGSRMLNILYNFQLSLTGTLAVTTVLLAALVLLEIYLYKKQEKRNVFLYVLCFILAVIWAMGESFRQMDSLLLWHAGAGQMVKTVVYILGITWFLTQAAAALTVFLASGWDLDRQRLWGKSIGEKHPFGLPFVGLLICWLPNLLLSYPATLCIDVWNQMLQFFGIQKFTTHHPPAHTVLLGWSEKLGLALGSGNLGLFFHIVLQTLLFALLLAYMFSAMRKMKTPAWLRGTTFITAVISPYYTQYFGMIVKDNLYSYGILLLVIEVVYMVMMKEEYWKEKKHLALLSLSIIGSMLFRNNGKYVIYPMIVLMMIVVLLQTRKKKGAGRVFLTAFLVCTVAVGAASGTQKYLVKHYQIEKGSIKEALSLPFQQTARYVKEHEDEVTEEEKKAIRGVLAYQQLPERYNPKISDPVKVTFKKKATTEDLKNYLRTWVRQGLKHPMTYIEATMNQNYYLVYPLVENNTLYDTTQPKKKSAQKLAEKLDIHEVPVIQKLDRWRTGWNKVLFSLPVLSLLSSMAFFNLLLIYLCYSAIRKRIPEMVMPLMPLLLSDAIILMAPVIKGHPRYAFPVIYALPMAFAAYLFFAQKQRKNFSMREEK